MARIDRPNHPPIPILIDEPSTRPKAKHHSADRFLLTANQMMHHQPGTDDVERADLQHVQRVIENVMLADLDVGKIELLQVRDVDIGGHDASGGTDTLSQPGHHRAPAGTDLKTAPPTPNEAAPSPRHRVVHSLERREPRVLGRLTPDTRKAVAPVEERFAGPRGEHRCVWVCDCAHN
jgi:hypothetical protein